MMPSGLSTPLLVGLAAVVAVVLAIAAAALVRARRYSREVRRLTDDVHALLASDGAEARIAVNGRATELVDVAASVNRLLDRATEAAAQTGQPAPTLFETLAATLPEVVLVHTSVILYANDAAGSLFGLEPSALEGRPVTDLLRPAYRATLRKHLDEPPPALEQPLAPIEVQLINSDERALWVELYSTRIDYRGEHAFLTVTRDISHRKSLEASLGRSKLQARVTLESIGEGVVTTDMQGIIDYMNEAAEQLIGTSRSYAIGKQLDELIALIDEVDRESLGDPVSRCLSERRRVSLGRRAVLVSKQAKREFSTELTASPIRGPDGELAGCVTIFHDVTEMRGLAREMSYQASHDALTGLVNRAEFERRLQGALESARGEGVGHVVAYLDLDRFKIVNDTSGHIAGDNLLRELATLVKDKVRDSDTIARVGGDEFAMLLVGCPLDKARQIADDICRAVDDYRFAWRQHVFDIGVSIGLVEVGAEAVSAESVLNAADSACYVAKQHGRGRTHVYSARDEMLARERGEIQWLQRLQQALKEDQFELYVQPIVSVGGRVASGPAAEMLLRMRGEAGKPFTPAQFLTAAERNHLMSHIDRWVVQAALTAISGGTPHLPDGRTCSINLSAQILGDDTFLEYVVDLLDHTGVPPSKICFEMSEAAVISNLDQARRFINVLHGMGCQFALDDFGSTFGSFSNLKLLSIDYLKINGAYTRDLDFNEVNRELVTAAVRLGKRLDFRVVAEQVEDHESFEAMREMGIDFIQGYIVERPHPLLTVH